MSYIDLTKVIKSIGYKAFKCLWYRHPRKALCKGLKPLNYDFNTLQLAEHVTGFDVVEVYVEDGVIDKCDKKLNDFKGDEVVVIDGVEAEPVVEGEVQVEGEVPVEVEVQVEAQVDVEPQRMDDIDVGVDKDDDDAGSKKSDEDYVGDEEDHDDSSDCTEYSDELDTPPGSEDEGPPKVRLPHFKVPKNDEDVKVEVGLQFQTQTQVTILNFITFTRDDCTFRIISSTSKA
ncbi:hypothetical protein GmHk_03G007504 [Glycine max]|nr:hypothetical protein GmHk_03G007504 [Glycine max]